MSRLYFEGIYDDSKLKSGLRRSNQEVSNWAKNAAHSGDTVEQMFKRVGQTASMFIGPITALSAAYKFVKLGKEALDFENAYGMAMREVQTISKAVQNDIEGISDRIVNLAANGPDDAIKLSKAFYQIVSAGYDGEAGLKLLEVSSKAATAGITDTTIAADGLTTVLNAWGISADNAGKVSDVMFKTVERGKTTFGELAQSIAQVAPLAAANKIGFEQIFAALQTITKQGTPTAQAMTQIRSSIVNMNKVLGDGWSASMTYQEGLNRIAQIAGGSQNKLKELIPDVEGVNAVLALTGEKAAGAAEDLNETTKSTGAMDKAYNTMMEEADNKWSQVHNKWTREMRDLGKAIKSGSTSLADFFNTLLTNTQADIIDPGAQKIIDDIASSIDGVTDKEEKLTIIISKINELRNKRIGELLPSSSDLEKQLPGLLRRNVEAFNAGIGLGPSFTPGRTKQAEFEYLNNQIEITKQAEKGLLKLFSEVSVKSAESNNNIKKSTETVQQQIEETTTAIVKAEKKLSDMRSPSNITTVTDIEDQEKTIKELKGKLETLTGIKKKETEKQIKNEQDQLEAQKDLNQKEVDLQLSKNRAIIALMQDGLDKQKALRKQSYEDQLADINKQEQAYLNDLNKKLGKKSTDQGYVISLSDYTNQNPSDTGAADYDKNLNDQRLVADQQYVKDIEKLDQDAADARKKIWDQATEAFLSDIDKEKKAVNDKYDDLVKQDIEAGATQAEIDKLNEQRTLALNQVQSDAALKLSSFYQQAFGDIEKYGTLTLKSLKKNIDSVLESAKQITQGGKTMIQVEIPTDQISEDGEVIKETVTMTIEEFQRLKDKGNEVSNAVDKNNPFSAFSKSFKKYKEALKSGNDKDISNATQSLIGNAQNALAEVKQLGAGLRDAFGDDVGDIADFLTGIGQGALDMAKGLATGDPIAILNGVVETYNTLTKGAKEYRAAQEAWMKDLIELQLQYNATLNEQIRLQDQANVFITDYETNAVNASKALIDAQNNLNKSLKGSSLENALSDLDIKTGVKKKKFLGITIGSKDVYGDLGESFSKLFPDEQFSDLVDQAGNLNTELAQTIVDSGLLKDDSEQLLKTWIEYQNEIDAANEAIADAVKSLAGEIGSDLAGALKDAWSDGKDGFKAFKDTVSSGLEDIISELAFNSVFTNSLTKLQDDLTSALTSGSDYNDIMQAYENFYSGADDLVDQYDDIMDANKKAAEAAGFDWSSSSSSASGLIGSAQSLTEETGGELAGIWRKTSDDTRVIRDYTKEGIDHLVRIEANTYNTVIELQNAVSRLDQIVTNTKPQSTGRDLGV